MGIEGETETEPGPRDAHALQRTAEHLARRFEGTFTADLVERCVFESYADLARTAKIRTYLAATAGHAAENRLRNLARFAEGGDAAGSRPAH